MHFAVRATAMLLMLNAAHSPPPAPEPSADCSMRLESLADAPRFQDYRAAGPRVARPAALALSSRDARRYRSLIAAQSAEGPNFAGRYTIVAWGCGAACTAFAIVDAESGRAHFPPALAAIHTAHVGDNGRSLPLRYAALRFAPDSRLLVVLGAPAGDEAREGAAFYEWTGTALRLVRFVPRAALCPQ
jgi:hypothetical protein